MFTKNKRKITTLILLLLLGISTFSQTEISGNITSDTILLAAQNPWVLNGNLYIKGNAILTIPEGTSIDLNNYKIYIGYSTPGKLIASGATFTTSSSSEKNIFFRDGGQGIVQNCQFNKVYIDIEDDAGDTLKFESNGFNDVEFPFIAVPHKMPEITGETSSITQIGLEGNVEDNATLSSNNWDFILTGTIRVQNNATLSVTSGVTIDFKNNSLYVGYNTPGNLNAEAATLKNSSLTQEIVNFRDGGTGIISNCQFDNVVIEIENDAGDTLQFTSNQFQNVSLPIDASPVRLPEIQGDISSVATIGISGYVDESCLLPLKEYTYTLSSNLYIRNNATINIEENVTINFDRFTLFIGNSTPGRLEAANVTFMSTLSSDKRIDFHNGGNGMIQNCIFENVYVKIEDDASDNINLNSNQFSNVNCPIDICIARTPTIEGNTCENNFIGLFGYLEENKTLTKYQWDYKLTTSTYIKNSATLSFAEDISIDFDRYNFNIGSSSQGVINASGVHFFSSSSSEKLIYIKDGSTGTISNCYLDNVSIKIENDAGDEISIQNNEFDNTDFPILLSVNKSPVISANTAKNPFIGLYGSLKENNTLLKYDWDYLLSSNVNVEDDATLVIDDGAVLGLNKKTLQMGTSSSDRCTLNAVNVHFTGDEKNWGKIYFYKNSEGNLENCLFEQVYIRINEGSPLFSNSRFYHSETAVEISEGSAPVFTNNDFYNNEEAIIYEGTTSLNVSGNYWGHSSGPQHESNPEGLGEIAEGNLSFFPVLEQPQTGQVTGSVSPQNFEFGVVLTGTRVDTAFTLTNNGDIDLMILGIKNSTSNISVRSPDRFWILPDSNQSISFSFTSLDDKLQKDTLILQTNDGENPEYVITMAALGEIDSLQIDFFKIEIDSFPVVTVHFSVFDQANLPVEGLVKENFSLREDNTPIENFELISQLAIPEDISAAIVIDRSGSMKGQPMRDAKNAANDLVGNLSLSDQAMVMSFAGEVTQHTPFTSDKTTLVSAINSIDAVGATALYTALIDAIETLKNQPGNKAIIALSDGENNVGSYSPLDIVSLALQHNITIFTIGLGEDIDPSALGYIASSTGGRYLYAPTSEALSIIYRIISGTLQNNYVIRYTAPEEGLVIRTLELTANYIGLTATDTIQYCTEKQVIEFIHGTPIFRMPEFYRNSKSYFYCLVNTEEHPLFKDQTFSFIQDKSYILPCEGKYLGDSIFQFCISFPEELKISRLEFVFPDSIFYYGNYIRLENKPPEFTVDLLKPGKTETIDVFAGGSLGATLLAGAAGAGPSVAAAKAGVSGTAGMGLTFEMDSEDFEYISRRFEAGVAEEVESPAINAGIGKIQTGAKAGVSLTGTLGQTMKFPNTSSNERKAKMLYLLETFSLGAVSLSPDCSILKQALHFALSQLSGGMMSAYNRLYYTEMYGLTLEGTASVGASFALNKGSDQNKLNLAEVGAGVTFSGQFIDYKQNSNKAINFGMAVNGGFSILELDILGLDLGALYGYTLGADMTLGADFTSSGLNAVNLVFGLTENEQIVFSEKNNRREFGINVPKEVISRALNDTTKMIASILPFFKPDANKFDFKISRNHFLESAGDFFEYATGDIDTVTEHVLIDVSKTETFCAEIGISAEIDAALIVGGGLELGVTLGYCEDETWPEKTYTVAEGRMLPLIEHGDPVDTDLLSLSDEIEFLFEYVTNLVKDVINDLIDLAEKIFEAGEEFAVSTYDEACTLAGQFLNSGEDITGSIWAKISSFNPGISIKNPFKSTLLDPVIIQGYRSSRVSFPGKNKIKAEGYTQDFLCLVSDCYRIKFYNESEQLIETFEPLDLTIAIDNEMLHEYGFSEEEKQTAMIYYYNFDSLMWYQIPGDFNDSPDTIKTKIERCGTYAAGILYNEAGDTDAPEILNWYPSQGETFDPDSVIFATYFEPPLGSGFNFTASGIKVDGEEVETAWNPVNNTLSFRPTEPLSSGLHTYEVTVADKNLNTASKTVTFNVEKTSSEELYVNSSLLVNTYPNPASTFLNIKLANCTPGKDYQLRVYNTKGQLIRQLFEGKVNSGNVGIVWDLSDQNRTRVASGIYLLRIKTGDDIVVKKLLVE